jgi:hypothetical protein
LTPLSTAPPRYPAYFTANLAAPRFSGNVVTVQWLAQNAGPVYLSYGGRTATPPYIWEGTGGRYIQVGTVPAGPATTGRFRILVPTDVVTVSLSIYAAHAPQAPQRFFATRHGARGTPQPPPGCCPPAPVYPTARPTYTPYPTPTPYVRANDYFRGDMVYSDRQPGGLHVGFRLLDVRSVDTPVPGADGRPQAVHIWTIQITNIGSIPYTVFPPAQMYISVIRPGDNPAAEVHGVWGPDMAAAEEVGLSFTAMTWDMQDIAPGTTKTYTLAAYGPRGTAWKVAYVLDLTQRDPDATDLTVVPGTNIVSWLNQVNTVCTGDITVP